MQTNTQPLQDAAIEIGITDCPDGLGDIHSPGVAAVIWRRQLVPDFQDWIDRLDPAALPSARLVLQPNAVRDSVKAICDGSGIPHGPDRERLIDDIVELSNKFAELMSAPYLRLRLDVISNNACSKFHIDSVVARLICTYRGTGTQYGISTNGGDPQRVFVVPTGAPILIRGKEWPEEPPSGLLHRSPPIEGTGETRLMLVLDPLSAAEETL